MLNQSLKCKGKEKENEEKLIAQNMWKKIPLIFKSILFYIALAIIIALVVSLLQSKITGQPPSVYGHRMYIVESGSMTPTIKVGSLIIVKESNADEIIKGDIITYRGMDSTVVTHRVTSVEVESKIRFTTKGDANETEDPLPVESRKLIGKVVFWIPYIGTLFGFVKTKVGFTLLIIFPLVIITIIQIIKKRNVLKDKSEKENREVEN